MQDCWCVRRKVVSTWRPARSNTKAGGVPTQGCLRPYLRFSLPALYRPASPRRFASSLRSPHARSISNAGSKAPFRYSPHREKCCSFAATANWGVGTALQMEITLDIWKATGILSETRAAQALEDPFLPHSRRTRDSSFYFCQLEFPIRECEREHPRDLNSSPCFTGKRVDFQTVSVGSADYPGSLRWGCKGRRG